MCSFTPEANTYYTDDRSVWDCRRLILSAFKGSDKKITNQIENLQKLHYKVKVGFILQKDSTTYKILLKAMFEMNEYTV